MENSIGYTSSPQISVRVNVDVMVTGVNPGVLAAKQATSTIPIGMTTGNDPVGSGLVQSLGVREATLPD